jgi:Rieske Fe-S protein
VRSVDALAPGQAGIVRRGASKVAAYREEDGTLHTVSAVCTHLGCQVKWNEAERSWDCPCHGSRFDPTGRVIQGPAVKDLEQKEPT